MSSETPTLAQVILEAIESRLVDLHTAIPGIVDSYDAATQTASVKPCIKRKYSDGSIVDLPVINKVPVVIPSGGGFFASFPIQKNDSVLLVFSERSLEYWKETGGVVNPGDPRKFHIADAFAIPGGLAKPSVFTNTDPEKLVIGHKDGNAEIHADKNGPVSIKASELILGAHTSSEFVAIRSRVETRLSDIESKLNSLISNYQTHVHPTAAPGAPSPSPTAATVTPIVPNPQDIGSAKVKVDP